MSKLITDYIKKEDINVLDKLCYLFATNKISMEEFEKYNHSEELSKIIDEIWEMINTTSSPYHIVDYYIGQFDICDGIDSCFYQCDELYLEAIRKINKVTINCSNCIHKGISGGRFFMECMQYGFQLSDGLEALNCKDFEN